MSDEDQFYVTLMSNSSYQDNPENTTASFTVTLPRNLNLVGDWGVALAEVHYQNTLNNVVKGHNKIIIDVEHKNGKNADIITLHQYEYEIPEGYYSNLAEIVDAINTATSITSVSQPNQPTFHIDKDGVTLTITSPLCGADDGHFTCYTKVVFEGRLAMQFGYPYGADVINTKLNHMPRVFFGYPSEILVYTDIIEPQIYADIHGKILRTIPTLRPDTRYGDVILWSFNPLHYMRLVKKDFKTVTIELRTSSGDSVAFAFGTTHLLLHFKKLKSESE